MRVSRSLNSDIEAIINKSEGVKKAKAEGEENLTPKEKKQLTEDRKEKQIFAQRNTGKAHQVCDPSSDFHVPHGRA